jgi:hypothetical protein
MLFAALLLVAQDGLSYQGPGFDEFSPDAYAIYFDRATTGPSIVLEGDGTDSLLTSIKTEKCVTRIQAKAQTGDNAFTGAERTLEIDWKAVDMVGQDVPYFFAVTRKGAQPLAFLTGGEKAGTALNQADMLSISTAYGAAILLHIACDPTAKARYEERAKPPEAAK